MLTSDERAASEKLKKMGLKAINLGKEISSELSVSGKRKHLDIYIHELLNKIVERNSVQIRENNQKVVVLYNMGILLEPVFALKPATILADLSKNVHIVILWSGNYENGTLSWNNRKEVFNLNFSEYGIRKINFSDEI